MFIDGVTPGTDLISLMAQLSQAKESAGTARVVSNAQEDVSKSLIAMVDSSHSLDTYA